MHIGLLQAGHLPDEMQAQVGDYETLYGKLLQDHGFDITTWSVVDDEFPPDVFAADGWLISGSKHGAYEDLPWIAKLEDFIREAYGAKRPLVGICFGHQVIAQALGGKVEKFGGGWAVGRHAYDWNGNEVALNAWHQDQVVEKPAGAEVVARSPFCRYAALVYPGGAFTVQAHPEFDTAALRSLIDCRGKGLVPDALLHKATQDMAHPTNEDRLALEIGTFFKEGLHG